MKIVIVGAGLSGCTLAERFAAHGHSVLLLEKRDHIAGNCYDFRNTLGILVSQYGPHFFHTSSERVWSYIQPFADWVPYTHTVKGTFGGKTFPIPVNIETVNTLLGTAIQTEEEMRAFLDDIQVPCANPKNSEDVALSRVGHALYKMIFQGYTQKQWEKDPSELDPAVLARIPVRYTFEERYFSDKYEALPRHGYTEFCAAMIRNPLIEVRLSTSYSPEVHKGDLVFYTGPIDLYFQEVGLPTLEYRSLRFEVEDHEVEFFQKSAVVNYTDTAVPWTRICEYKHLLNQDASGTTIVKEYPSSVGEPYYPIPSDRNKALYEHYKRLAEAEEKKGVYFVGRLANYKYFNMDQAIENALCVFDKVYPTL